MKKKKMCIRLFLASIQEKVGNDMRKSYKNTHLDWLAQSELGVCIYWWGY